MPTTKKQSLADIARSHAMQLPIGTKFTNYDIAKTMNVKPNCIHTCYRLLIKNGNLTSEKPGNKKTRASIYTKASNKALPKNIPEITNQQPLFNNFTEHWYKFAYGATQSQQTEL